MPPQIRPTGVLCDDHLISVQDLQHMGLGVNQCGHAQKRFLEDMTPWSSEGDSYDHSVSFLVINFSSQRFLVHVETDSLSCVVPKIACGK
jgi:hypothetical protein